MARAKDPIQARCAAAHVVATLKDAGHIAYFAGGCVRDELLGLAPTDYDVATDATPSRVATLFERTMHVGAAFGVVLVPLPGGTIEVATFRSDGPYSDARRPDRVHFSDPESDARRRDFTINALFLDPLAPPDPSISPPGRRGQNVRGRVIDYVGGLADLDAGLIRAVGDPDLRLAEDHLRALRAVRFAARLAFSIDPGTSRAIARHAAELRGVSRERIGEEVRRMFLHPSRAMAAGLLQNLGLDAPVLDAPHATPPLATLEGLQPDGSPEGIPYTTCLAAWALDRLPADAEPAAAPPARSRKGRSRVEGIVGTWRDSLRLSNDERDLLASTLAAFAAMKSEWLSAGVAVQKRMAARTGFQEALRLMRVREPGVASAVTARLEALRATESGLDPEPFLSGDDLISLGIIQPGPRFKEILDRIFDAQLEGSIRSRPEAMELARRLCV